MTHRAHDDLPLDPTRRALLAGVAVCAGAGVLLAMSPSAQAADAGSLPMLQESDPAGQATQYVSDAHHAKAAAAGANCANCALYGSLNPKAGTCSIFPKNLVAAGGWCNAWSSL